MQKTKTFTSDLSEVVRRSKINAKNTTVDQALGIEATRAKQLEYIVSGVLLDSDYHTRSKEIEYMVSQCDTLEEIIYTCWNYGQSLYQLRSRNKGENDQEVIAQLQAVMTELMRQAGGLEQEQSIFADEPKKKKTLKA